MAYSAKIRLNKQRTKLDGTQTVYMQVIINRNKIMIPLDISWDPGHFDEKEKYCKKGTKNDEHAEDYNLIIGNAMGKANEIFTRHKLAGKPLTPKRFRDEYNQKYSRDSFIDYFRQKIDERYKHGDIEEQTWKNHNNVFRKFSEFTEGKLLFQDIDEKTLKLFDVWMKKKKKSQNTRWGHIKDVKTYLSLAKKDGIIFSERFNEHKVQQVAGNVNPLTLEEFNALYNYYFSEEAFEIEKRVLAPFLFSCLNGGLRISDQKRVEHDDIKGGFLIFVAHKGRKQGKLIHVPILDEAMKLIRTEKGKLFDCISEQAANRVLKEIASKLGIKKNLRHHMARDSFGTLYIAMGGNPAILKELMGHSKYQTTLKYVHVNDMMKADNMQVMKSVVKTPTPS